MRTLLSLLPALACAGGMFWCVRMMGGARKKATSHEAAAEPGLQAVEVANLRDEVRSLQAQLDAQRQDDTTDS